MIPQTYGKFENCKGFFCIQIVFGPNHLLHLACTLMEHFLEGINPNEKSNKYKSCLLSYITKALMEHFLQGNVPLGHLLNAKPPFMS